MGSSPNALVPVTGSPSVTLASVRGQLKKVHPRIFFQQTLLYLTATGMVAVGWALVIAQVLAWGWLGGILFWASSALTLLVLWSLSSIAFLIQSGRSRVQRMSRGWMLAIGLSSVLGGLLLSPWWMALVIGGLGLGLTPLLGRLAQRFELSRLTAFGLPAELREPLERLPANVPPEVQLVLDLAFRDWIHLRDIIGYAGDSALRFFVDTKALHQDAQKTLIHMLRRAPLVAKLWQIAQERGEPEARKVADAALRRLRKVGEELHEAVSTASQFAAYEQREEAQVLQARIEGLRMLAESLDVDPGSVDSSYGAQP